MMWILFTVYALILIGAFLLILRWAGATNRNPFAWGVFAIFIILIFWDWIPTLLAHKYYCSTQAGFIVFKTPEQWKAENTDLTAVDLINLGEKMRMGGYQNQPVLEVWKFPFLPFYNNKERHATMVNKRIYLDSKIDRNTSEFLPIRKITSFIADTKNDEKLAEQITFGSGYSNPFVIGGLQGLKEWLNNSNCSHTDGGTDEELSGYTGYIDLITKLEGQNSNQ
jgi:hypothetical protein